MSYAAGGTQNATASSSTAHLTQSYPQVRHRHDKQPALSTSTPSGPQFRSKRTRRKNRNGSSRWSNPLWRIGGPGWVTEGFRRFGEHCARNQIRTLLIDCLVMTNLFYPSLALYQQKRASQSEPSTSSEYIHHETPVHEVGYTSRTRDRPFSIFGTPVLDTFFPHPPPLLPRLNWAGWWGRDTGQWDEPGWSATRVPISGEALAVDEDEEIRLMCVGWADVGAVLDTQEGDREHMWTEGNNRFLRLVRDMAEEWETQVSASGQSCVRQLHLDETGLSTSGPCYIVSPETTPTNDENAIVTTLSTLQLGLGDVGKNHTGIYHSVAVPFRIPRNGSADFQSRWLSSVGKVAKQLAGEVFVEAVNLGDPTGEWLLSYAGSPLTSSSASVDSPVPDIISPSPPRIVLFLYLLLFTTLGAQLSNASKVHSRFGLAFTGVVQLCCSSVMSFSVLALLGWNGWGSSRSQSSLPTYVLPFVIVVVGAENMSTLTKAIFSIPFSHSVPVRIGLGLSKVGTTIALTSLTDLLLLGVIWLCVNLQPVREFCLFAAVVIITDWFMLHTFFLTVLSIDAQRLELADVLTSNGVAPSTPVQPVTKAEERSEGQVIGFSWRKALRARSTRSASLVLLLISVGLLYWLTERHRIHVSTPATLYGYTPPLRPSIPSGPTAASPTVPVSTITDLSSLSQSERLWRAINIHGSPFTRVVVPPTTIVILPKPGHSMLPADLRKLQSSMPTRRLLLPRFKPLFYLLKVVLLPQALTAGALYSLLLYLLKDADLLDAQRNRLGRFNDAPSGDETHGKTSLGLLGGISAQMLPCSHESDAEIIASSSDGRLAISIAIDNSVCLWRFNLDQRGTGTREPLKTTGTTPDDPLVTAAVSEDGRHAAVCTRNGILQIWDVPYDGSAAVQPLRRVSILPELYIVDITFEVSNNATGDPFRAVPPYNADVQPQHTSKILLALSDGSVVSSFISTKNEPTSAIDHARSGAGKTPSRCQFLLSKGELDHIVALPDSCIIRRNIEARWTSSTLIPDLKEDHITAISARCAELPGLFALGHRSGCIEIHDEAVGHLLSIAQGLSIGAIRRIEIVRPPTSRCVRCGTISSDGWYVISSTTTQVYIDRVSPKSYSSATFCRCAIRRGSSLDDLVTASQKSPHQPSSVSRGDGFDQSIILPPSSARRRNTPGSSPRKSPSLLPPVSNGEFPLSSHGGARRLSNLHREDTQLLTESSLAMSTSGTVQAKGRPSSPLDRANPNPSPGQTSPSGEMEITPLGGISAQNGGWTTLGNLLIGFRRAREGIDDSQWQVWAVDLSAPWNGQTLSVETVELETLLSDKRYPARPIGGHTSLSPKLDVPTSVPMRDRRAERLLSLNGQASFPERLSTSGSGSFSVRTHPALGYVSVRKVQALGEDQIIAGFGNRLGILTLPKRDKKDGKSVGSIGGQSASSLIGVGAGGTPIARRSLASSLPFTPPPPKASAVAGASPGSVKVEFGRKVD